MCILYLAILRYVHTVSGYSQRVHIHVYNTCTLCSCMPSPTIHSTFPPPPSPQPLSGASVDVLVNSPRHTSPTHADAELLGDGDVDELSKELEKERCVSVSVVRSVHKTYERTCTCMRFIINHSQA